MSAISSQCTGKWSSILLTLGIDQTHLSGKHAPCPACGGKDRFRFDNKDGRGTFYCSNCGAGDGFTLLQKVNDWTFSECAKEIEKIVGKCSATQSDVKPKQATNEQRLKRIHSGLKRITRDDAVWRYLKGRGIDILPKNDVFFHPAIDYWHRDDAGKPVKVGTFPAMVSVMRNLDDEVCTYHVTYLTDEGQKISGYPAKKMMPIIKPLPGASIRLGGQGEMVGISEGIETALAAQQLEGYPCWAAANAVLMEQVQVPSYIGAVVIYPDEDASFTGQAAAYALAKRLKAEGKTVYVSRLLGLDGQIIIDSGADRDYCDYIKEQNAEVF
ncbi:primase-helicase zinc-binding domain-containing protein [Methylotuvimicrobium sp. KM2]|uniref:DUF7146 domain-containing protein n=1 Tax=Methylotuvimicrobium sp. KM2 TaxID=3133976 RepID=UPI003100B970